MLATSHGQSNGSKRVKLGSFLHEVNVRASSMSDHLPVLSLTRHSGLVLQTDRFKNPVASEDTSNYKVVLPGQLVYSPIKVWEGGIGVLELPHAGVVSPVYAVWEIDGVDSEFIHYLLRSPRLVEEYSRFAEGTGQRRQALSRNDFLAIEIGLPTLEEQRRLARILSTIRGSREASGKASSVLAALMRAAESTLLDGLGVPTVRLGDVTVRRQYGLSVRGDATGSWPLLRMTNVANGAVNFDGLQFVDMSDTAAAPYLVEDGDVLFNRTNSPQLVGRCGLVRNPPPCVFASYLIRLRADPARVLPEYLNIYLNWEPIQQRIREMATRGVSQANVSASKLAELEIRIPSLDEQSHIASVFRRIQSRRIAEDKWSSSLDRCFGAALAHLFASS